jgi:OOP family OmpA-OmpF porin
MRRAFLLGSVVALAACAHQEPPPPPAPPPAPPPPVEHNFTVFFDWDKANITPEGAQIIDAAAATFKSMPGGTPVQVIGHTDTSGSPAYNQRLSVRRAEVVANGLQQSGVPQGAMTVTGVGQNDLKVPTPPGVREPQNRRTEIIEGGSPPPPPGPPPGPPGAPPAPGS